MCYADKLCFLRPIAFLCRVLDLIYVSATFLILLLLLLNFYWQIHNIWGKQLWSDFFFQRRRNRLCSRFTFNTMLNFWVWLPVLVLITFNFEKYSQHTLHLKTKVKIIWIIYIAQLVIARLLLIRKYIMFVNYINCPRIFAIENSCTSLLFVRGGFQSLIKESEIKENYLKLAPSNYPLLDLP